MSKGGGVSGSNINVGIEDLLAMNPELIEQLATEPAAQTSAPVEQAAPIPFYGSGNEILWKLHVKAALLVGNLVKDTCAVCRCGLTSPKRSSFVFLAVIKRLQPNVNVVLKSDVM